MDFNLVDVAVLSWSKGRITRAEGACEPVLGALPETLMGSTLHEVLGITKEQAEVLKATPGPTPQVEFVRARLVEEPVWVRLSLGHTPWGEPGAAIMNMDQILAGAPPLQIFRLSSSLSHEIRNPLSSVKMAVQTLARNTTLGERDQRRLVIANREVRTMERLLSLLSEYGRDSPPMLESVPLKSLVEDAANQVKPELEERRIQLLIEGDDEAALPKVRADAGRLRPVLAQLLLNIASGQAEGSTLRARLAAAKSACELSVTDTTAAIPPEERSKIFEPFSSFLTREAGLSLAALSRVMRGLGGTVSADGGSPSGTLYTLTFPI